MFFGYWTPIQTGTYYLKLYVDDKAILWFGDDAKTDRFNYSNRLILAGLESETTASINITAGTKYPIRILFANTVIDSIGYVKLTYTTATDSTPRIIPFTQFSQNQNISAVKVDGGALIDELYVGAFRLKLLIS